MNSRDEILNRLRSSSEAKPATERSDWKDKTIFSDYPRTAGELLSEFRRHIEILAGELHVFESMANLAEAIPHLLWKSWIFWFP